MMRVATRHFGESSAYGTRKVERRTCGASSARPAEWRRHRGIIQNVQSPSDIRTAMLSACNRNANEEGSSALALHRHELSSDVRCRMRDVCGPFQPRNQEADRSITLAVRDIKQCASRDDVDYAILLGRD